MQEDRPNGKKRKFFSLTCFQPTATKEQTLSTAGQPSASTQRNDQRSNFLSRLFNRSLSLDGKAQQKQRPNAPPPKPPKMKKLWDYGGRSAAVGAGKGGVGLSADTRSEMRKDKRANRLAVNITSQATDSNTAPAVLNVERITNSSQAQPSAAAPQSNNNSNAPHDAKMAAAQTHNQPLSTIREGSTSIQVSSAGPVRSTDPQSGDREAASGTSPEQRPYAPEQGAGAGRGPGDVAMAVPDALPEVDVNDFADFLMEEDPQQLPDLDLNLILNGIGDAGMLMDYEANGAGANGGAAPQGHIALPPPQTMPVAPQPQHQAPLPPQPQQPQFVIGPDGQPIVVDFVRNARRAKPGAGEVRNCTKCGISETPQWRAGPQGPATLCNACGVAYRKTVKKVKEQLGGAGAK